MQGGGHWLYANGVVGVMLNDDAATNQSSMNSLLKIRVLIGAFMMGLILSGITAFPLLHELNILCSLLGVSEAQHATGYSGLSWWILRVREGLRATYAQYPFMAYGTDWLAFGHLTIALFFIAPMIDPVRNIAVLYTGLAGPSGKSLSTGGLSIAPSAS